MITSIAPSSSSSSSSPDFIFLWVLFFWGLTSDENTTVAAQTKMSSFPMWKKANAPPWRKKKLLGKWMMFSCPQKNWENPRRRPRRKWWWWWCYNLVSREKEKEKKKKKKKMMMMIQSCIDFLLYTSATEKRRWIKITHKWSTANLNLVKEILLQR
jgi:hypothetical protein